MYIKRLKQSAFTIAELAISIAVVGVLAVIVLVSYGAMQGRATSTILTSDLGVVAKILSVDFVNNGVYPATIADANNYKGLPVSSGTSYNNYFPTSTGFCITATKDAISYRVTNKTNPRKGVCAGTVRDLNSAIKWTSWTLGTGSVAGYTINGDGNSRINDLDPWGNTSIVWDVSNQDVASDADGGWGGAYFAIDNTKTYRFTTFIKRKTLGNGTTYMGLNGSPVSVLNRSDSVLNGNPYFTARAWWGNINEWYLVVGHVWPAGSGSGSIKADSGIYNMSGNKLFTTSDYVWQATTTSTLHRSYLYYSTDATTNQQFFQPRVEVVDGTEPTIPELLSDSF